MKRILQLITVCVPLFLSSCDFINNKILENSIEGTYKNGEGTRMEFTKSKVTYQDVASFTYKIEGKYLYVENFGIGEMKFGDMRYEIIDPHTLKQANSFSLNKDDKTLIFRKTK